MSKFQQIHARLVHFIDKVHKVEHDLTGKVMIDLELAKSGVQKILQLIAQNPGGEHGLVLADGDVKGIITHGQDILKDLEKASGDFEAEAKDAAMYARDHMKLALTNLIQIDADQSKVAAVTPEVSAEVAEAPVEKKSAAGSEESSAPSSAEIAPAIVDKSNDGVVDATAAPEFTVPDIAGQNAVVEEEMAKQDQAEASKAEPVVLTPDSQPDPRGMLQEGAHKPSVDPLIIHEAKTEGLAAPDQN